MSVTGDSRICRLATARIILADFCRHTSHCGGVGCFCSPQSLTYVSSWGLAHLPPCHSMNYFADRRHRYFMEESGGLMSPSISIEMPAIASVNGVTYI